MMSGQSNKTKLLEEIATEEFQPTKDEIIEYGKTIGIDTDKEQIFLPIAEEGIKASLPQDWEVYEDENKHIYFYNTKTQESSWNHPMDSFYRQKVEMQRKQLNQQDIPTPAPRRSSISSKSAQRTKSPALKSFKCLNEDYDERKFLYNELRKELQTADFGLHKKMFSLEAKTICEKTVERFITIAQSRFEKKYQTLKFDYDTKITELKKKCEEEIAVMRHKCNNDKVNSQDSSLTNPTFFSKEDLKKMNLQEVTLESNRIDKRLRRCKQLYRDYKAYSTQLSRQLSILESSISIDFSADALAFQITRLSIGDQNSESRRSVRRGSFDRSSSVPRTFNSTRSESRGVGLSNKISDLSGESESDNRSLSYHQQLPQVRPSIGVSPNMKPDLHKRDSFRTAQNEKTAHASTVYNSDAACQNKTPQTSQKRISRFRDSTVGVFGTQFDSPLESVTADSIFTRFSRSPLETVNGSNSSGRGSSGTTGVLSSFSSLS